MKLHWPFHIYANENILLLVLGWVLFAFTFFFCKFVKNAYFELKMKPIIKFKVQMSYI